MKEFEHSRKLFPSETLNDTAKRIFKGSLIFRDNDTMNKVIEQFASKFVEEGMKMVNKLKEKPEELQKFIDAYKLIQDGSVKDWLKDKIKRE